MLLIQQYTIDYSLVLSSEPDGENFTVAVGGSAGSPFPGSAVPVVRNS